MRATNPENDIRGNIGDLRAARSVAPDMNTFQKYFIRDFPAFTRKIPVAKKACKLLKTMPLLVPLRRNPDLVKYRSFFELTNAPVKGKRIAAVDDATQYTSTLLDYRR